MYKIVFSSRNQAFNEREMKEYKMASKKTTKKLNQTTMDLTRKRSLKEQGLEDDT